MGTAKIDGLLQGAVSNGELPGVVAFAADSKGVIYQGAYGRRAIDSDAPMTCDTVFWIASMSKPITTVAALQLVEKGKLKLDEPLGGLLPELATVKVLEEFDNDGVSHLRDSKRPVTLRHLLTHTSGFAYDFLNESLLRYYMNETIPPIGECKNITLLKTPLLFDPGDRWEYGIGLDWAGKAIEAASGQPFNDYLWDNILAPLAMNDTAFIIKPAMRSRLAAVHVRNADGSLVRIEFEMPREPEFCMGGSGLYSTAGDYLTFLQMILHGGTLNGVSILQPETVQKMGRNQIGDLNVPPLKSAIPALANDVEFFPGMVKKWGLGFMLTTEDAPTGRSAWSMSWCGIANTYFWVDPVKQVIGGALTQVLPGADARAEDLFARFEASVYQQL